MTRHMTRWTAILLTVALIGVAFTALAQERESRIDENFLLLMGARNAGKAGKHDTSVRRYRKLLERDPQLNDARRELGWVLIAAGRVAEAEQEFRVALHANPKDAEAWKGILEALRKTDQKDELLKVLDRLVELEPTRKDLRMQLALELHNRSRFTEAERHIVILLGE